MNAAHWRPVYFGLGSNLDQPDQHLSLALRELDAIAGVRLYSVSSMVRSAPVDGSAQPDYLNAVAAGMTCLEPLVLLAACQQIERAHGRDHDAPRWSARPLDIDLLVIGSLTHDTDQLGLPHRQIARRAFVVQPLAELAPHLMIPGAGAVKKLLNDVDAEALTPVTAVLSIHPPNGLS